MEPEKFEWDDLHDAVLEEISVTWAEFAEVEIRFLPNRAYIESGDPVLLTGESLQILRCPQKNPWGPSDFVNRISSTQEDSCTRIDIEMQSGDVIRVEAKSFNIKIGG